MHQVKHKNPGKGVGPDPLRTHLDLSTRSRRSQILAPLRHDTPGTLDGGVAGTDEICLPPGECYWLQTTSVIYVSEIGYTVTDGVTSYTGGGASQYLR